MPASLANLGSDSVFGLVGTLVTAVWAKGLPFALLGGLIAILRRTNPLRFVALSSTAYALLELGISRWSLGVPWALLGHSQIEAAGVAQLATVGGVPLVSGLLMAVGASTAVALERGASWERWRLPATFMAAWLACAAFGLPVAQSARPASLAPEQSSRLLLVQPNLRRGERWAPELQIRHLDKVVDATRAFMAEAPKRPDVVIWPENLVTSPVDTTPDLKSALEAHVRSLGVPVILGAARSASDPSAAKVIRSSVLWMSEDGDLIASVDKRRAIPVLESSASLPGQALLDAAYGEATRWVKVEEIDKLQTLEAEFSFVTLLCYEALFPALAAEQRTDRSVAILNLADDSWAAGEMATRQLTAYARFRAIEQRLPLIRVAHGGLSVVTDEFGQLVEELPSGTYASTTVEVWPRPPVTLQERATILALPLLTGLGVWWLVGLAIRRGS
jgi:apolipoprotein N-acyltransferase